ncbi:hypothetical protein [Gluconacetobacter entanii]|nr:hypothetical protein [Gluconacetobacter entanii]
MSSDNAPVARTPAEEYARRHKGRIYGVALTFGALATILYVLSLVRI